MHTGKQIKVKRSGMRKKRRTVEVRSGECSVRVALVAVSRSERSVGHVFIQQRSVRVESDDLKQWLLDLHERVRIVNPAMHNILPQRDVSKDTSGIRMKLFLF